MGLKDRIRNLEGSREPERCPECQGRIFVFEHKPDGTVDYLAGRPCSTCGNRSADGSIRRIEVVYEGEVGDVGHGMPPNERQAREGRDRGDPT